MTSSAGYSTRVYVRDLAGRAVSGAVVEAIWWDCFPAIRSSAITDDGVATLNIPAGAQVSGVLALKPFAGMDYFENFRSWPPHNRLSDLPSEVHLVLDGAREVAVQAVDSSGRPVSNVRLTPWTVKKKGKLAYVN